MSRGGQRRVSRDEQTEEPVCPSPLIRVLVDCCARSRRRGTQPKGEGDSRRTVLTNSDFMGFGGCWLVSKLTFVKMRTL
jgi:hypothetical protein